MEIINLTPHDINFIDDSNNVMRTIKPSGTITRIAVDMKRTGSLIEGIPVTHTEYGFVRDMPKPKKGVIYVASQMVCERLPRRHDLYYPAEPVRDASGNVIGCRALGRV